MKNTNKIITISVVLLLLFLIVPSATTKEINNERDILGKNTNTGKISGTLSLYTSSWIVPEPLSGMKVTVDGKNDYSDIHGYFEIKNLPLNKNYEVVFHFKGRKVRTRDVYISTNSPDYTLNEDFHIRDLYKSKEKTTTEIGTIYGNTGTSLIWGFTPVPFATVTAGFKCTVSLYPLGSYRITGLPLNKKITVTESKRGYTECTKTVILTDNNPAKQVFLNMERDGEGIKSKNINFLRNLFSSTFFSTNTRSNLFSTFSFVS